MGDRSRMRACEDADFNQIFEVINDSAKAYKGVVPKELYREPYISRDYLRSEIDQGVRFQAYFKGDSLLGVMGAQKMGEVTLVRHAYVRTKDRRDGIGSKLLTQIVDEVNGPILVGCLRAMTWAVCFYQKHGFEMLDDERRDRLRAKYWSLPENHIRQSVVLALRYESSD